MTHRTTTTVGELAAQLPNATRVFEKYGIDYCCGGRESVEKACASAGVALDDLLEQIEGVSESLPVTNYESLGQSDLIDHIIKTHHVFTRDELTRLDALLKKVVSVHGARHPELMTIRETFQKVHEDLLPHMMKEENVLFPYIVELGRCTEQGVRPAPPRFGTVRNPVRMMMFEHETVGALLAELRTLTSNYTAPPDACVSYSTLYAALANLESDLHQHIHLENNILFTRAVRQELNFL
jgi:regulator of cell morphogenesis and NO signaling